VVEDFVERGAPLVHSFVNDGGVPVKFKQETFKIQVNLSGGKKCCNYLKHGQIYFKKTDGEINGYYQVEGHGDNALNSYSERVQLQSQLGH
jgi:hypothetical protein